MMRPMMPNHNPLNIMELDARDEAWADWDNSNQDWQLQAAGYLAVEKIRRECRWLGMEPEMEQVFVRAGVAIGTDVHLARLFWHVHWVLSQPDGSVQPRRNWSMLPERYGEPGRMLYAMVCLSCFEQARQRNARRGIEEALTKQTLSDLPLWVRHYHRQRGEWGFAEMYWLTGHLMGQLHQLGRLQFQVACFPHDFHLFRSVDDGKMVMLAGQGMRFRSDGQFDGAEGICDQTRAWVATYRQAGDFIAGNPISAEGSARQEAVSVEPGKWESCLSVGDPVLEVHIPACGTMDRQSCDESFRLAGEFFPRHFPDHPFKAFTCESWLMDSQLSQCLPASSNIVAFLRRFHRYPLPRANGHQTLERVFGSRKVDLARVPRVTVLQRCIAAHMKAGGRWRDAGGVILRG